MMLELNKIYNMDCLDGMRQMDSDSVDCAVLDPPYGISFMSKRWDIDVPSIDICKEMLRVMKSGSFAFICMSPRQDVLAKMINNMHEAGFNTNFTSIYWAYASGFPKAMNISKKVVDFLGAERDKIKPTGSMHKDKQVFGEYSGKQDSDNPITSQAMRLNGSYAGFQPKPAVEVIIVAMKPLSQDSYIKQALNNNKGVTWLDDCRIPYVNEDDRESTSPQSCPALRNSESQLKSDFKVGVVTDYETGKLTFRGDGSGQNHFAQYLVDKRGRFPANLLVSDDVLNDGHISISKPSQPHLMNPNVPTGNFLNGVEMQYGSNIEDSGSFSRYFDLDRWYQDKVSKLPKEVRDVYPFLIVPKASPNEKQEGLKGFEELPKFSSLNTKNGSGERLDGQPTTKSCNIHPTVKPIDLMTYLITLGSRDNDVILDPFMGSGTTAIACRLINRRFIGFELNEEYCKIANGRLKEHIIQKKLSEIP